MPLIHNGAPFWDTHDQAGDPPLGQYFAGRDARDSEPAAAALEAWPRIVTPTDGDLQSPSRPRDELRATAEAALSDIPLPRRCIFVSHRRIDWAIAEHLANAILAHHPPGAQPFDVWLDVWDPTLNLMQPIAGLKPGILTALIIEMGLINSLAVIALVTPNSPGSRWIPYEFGRVKKGGPFAQEAAACLHGLNCVPPHHDYMDLAPQINNANGCFDGLNGWLDRL